MPIPLASAASHTVAHARTHTKSPLLLSSAATASIAAIANVAHAHNWACAFHHCMTVHLPTGRCIHMRRQLRSLTDPLVVSKHVLSADWSPEELLASVALHSPTPHALIDAGALVTGLSNEQVAARLLARLPAATFDGVVFLEHGGHKRILLRAGGGAMDLERCGVPKERRFSFYDQGELTPCTARAEGPMEDSPRH